MLLKSCYILVTNSTNEDVYGHRIERPRSGPCDFFEHGAKLSECECDCIEL